MIHDAVDEFKSSRNLIPAFTYNGSSVALSILDRHTRQPAEMD